MSNFLFLKNEWPDLFESASRAERFIENDARAACFYARRTLELAARWLYKHDPALKTAQRASLAELDALFATLEHRAFKREIMSYSQFGNNLLTGYPQ